MVLLATLVVEYIVDISDLEKKTDQAIALQQKFEQTASGTSKVGQAYTQVASNVAKFTTAAGSASKSASSLASAQAKASVAAAKVAEAEAQVALTLKKVEDLQNRGRASAEQLAVAQAKAATAAEKVKVAEANAAVAMQKVAATAEKEQAALRDAAQSATQMEIASKKVASSSSTAASKAVSFASSLAHVGTTASAAKAHVSGLGMSILDFGNKLGGTIDAIKSLASGALGLGKSLLMPAMNAEQTRIAFTNLLHSADEAAKMMQKIDDLAVKMNNFGLEDLQAGAKQLLAFKFAGDDVPLMLQRIGDAVSNVGGGAEGMQRVIMALGQMRLKGKVTGEEMLQLTEANIGAWDYLEKALGKPTAELQKMASQGLIPADTAIQAIIDGLREFDGGAEAMGKSALGMAGALQDAFNIKILKSFGEGLLTPLKGVMGELTKMFNNPAFQQFATMLGEQIGSGINNLVGFFKEASTWIDTFMRSASGDGLINLVHSFEDLGRTLNFGPALQSISNLLAQVFSKSGAIEGGIAVNDAFNGIATAVNFASDAIKGVQAGFEAAWPFLEAIGAFLAEKFTPVWDALVRVVQTQVLPAWNDLIKGLEPIMPTILEIAGVIGLVLAGMLGGLVSAIAGALPHIMQAIGGIIMFLSGFVQFLTGVVTFIYDLFTGNFDRLGHDLNTIFGGIGRMFAGWWQFISGLFLAAIGWIVGYVTGFWQTVVGIFTKMWDQLVGHSIIPDMVNGIVKWLLDLGPRGLAAITSFIESIKKAITDFAAKCISLGQSIINGIVDGIKSIAGNIGAAIKSVVSGAAASVGITIPGFASGVTDFSGGLALVGERGPELVHLPQHSSVIPMNSSPARSSTVSPSRSSFGKDRQQTMVVNLELDGRTIGQYAAEYIDGQARAKFGPRSRIA